MTKKKLVQVWKKRNGKLVAEWKKLKQEEVSYKSWMAPRNGGYSAKGEAQSSDPQPPRGKAVVTRVDSRDSKR